MLIGSITALGLTVAVSILRDTLTIVAGPL